jgi:autotransporter translocation and assembly factor TamB
LQGWANLRTQELATANDASRLSTEADLRFAAGTLNTRISLTLTGCSPVEVQASLPIRLSNWDEASATEPVSATVTVPALFANRLPRYLSHDVLRDGIISGKTDIAGSLRHPSISGDLQLSNGKLGLTNFNLTDASARLTFKGDNAVIDFLNLANQEIDLSLRGSVDFADLTAIELRLTASEAVVDLAPRRSAQCVNRIRVTALPAQEQPIVANIDAVALRGSLFSKPWSVSLTDHRPDEAGGAVEAAAAIRSFPFCADEKESGSPIIFGCERRSLPQPEPSPKKRRISRHRKAG